MSVIELQIAGAEKLIGVFGYWPSFHDAEVTEVLLQRGGGPDSCPVLIATIHVFETTREVSSTGHYVCRHHSQVRIKFTDISELQLEHFNHQNALSGLGIEHAPDSDGKSAAFHVSLLSAYGLDGTFACRSIELVSVTAGIPPGSVYADALAGA